MSQPISICQSRVFPKLTDLSNILHLSLCLHTFGEAYLGRVVIESACTIAYVLINKSTQRRFMPCAHQVKFSAPLSAVFLHFEARLGEVVLRPVVQRVSTQL